ncbi:MAG: hypothetical protein COA57_11395 [Flavobacteriales bacterium]|nr:MAG: hypothetical protein COA57_11395 [Flavobacteriales bacterium]
MRTFIGHTEVINSVCFSPDGKYALSGSLDKTLKLWEVATGEEIRTFSGHTKRVTCVDFSTDGKYALSGSMDSTLILWDVETGEKQEFLQTTTRWFFRPVFHLMANMCFRVVGLIHCYGM